MQYPLFALLGWSPGLVGVAFSRVLYAIEDACDWAWRGPEWVRPAVGGLLLGGLLLVLPEMYGVGYPVLGKAVAGGYGVALPPRPAGRKARRLQPDHRHRRLRRRVRTRACSAGPWPAPCSATSSTPSLPGSGGSLGAYALVGMGAVFAGAARAPITAVVILFELTGEYSIILPLMLAIVLATGVSHSISHDTVYTRKLLRRGIDIDEPADASLRRRPGQRGHVQPPASVEADASLRSVAGALRRRWQRLAAGHRLRRALPRTLAAHDLMAALASGEDNTVQALTVSTAPLLPSASIGDALKQLDTPPTPSPSRVRTGHRRLGTAPGHAQRTQRRPGDRGSLGASRRRNVGRDRPTPCH